MKQNLFYRYRLPLNKKGITGRIILLSTFLTIFATFTTGFFSLFNIWKDGKKEIAFFHKSMIEQYNIRIKSQNDSFYGLLIHYYERSQSGELTEEDAKQRILKRIESVRYDEGAFDEATGYFWIHTSKLDDPWNAVMVMHPTSPELNNKNVKDTTDFTYFKKLYVENKLYDKNDPYIKKNIKSTKLFSEMNEIAITQGEGFVDYYWPKPLLSGSVTQEGYHKKSFVRYFKPWEWVLGTGVYVDDMEKKIALLKDEIQLKINRTIQQTLIAIFICLTIGLILSVVLSNRITRPIKKLQSAALKISQGDYQSRISEKNKFPYEIAKTAEAFNIMSNAIYKRDEKLQKRNKEIEKLLDKITHSQKMEALGQLAGGIAHDFNNLLGGILGASHLMKIEGHLDSNSQENIDIIISSSKRAALLTNQLLTFSRKTGFRKEDIIVNDVIKEVISILKHTIKNITIDCKLTETQCYVAGDATQLQQAILNVAVNARDAMSEGGTITIESHPSQEKDIEKVNLPSGNYFYILISDTGEGMKEETLKHIFEPFFTTKEKGKGTGLGLAVASDVVKRHNGFIFVESKLGKGSLFKIYLPVKECLEEQESTAEKQFVKGQGQILCIDDEEALRVVFSKMLKALGYDVMTFEDPKKIISYYKKNYKEISLVLIDTIIPIMNGLQIHSELKKINPKIKTIFISGLEFPQEIQRLIEKGITEVIKKPFDLSEISHLVAEMLKK